MRADIAARLADSLRDRAEARRRPRGRRIRRRQQGRQDGERRSAGSSFSEKFACPVSGFTISEIEPRLFSFNNPFGACPACDGLGTKQRSTPSSSCPTRTLTLRDGAIAPWAKSTSPYYAQTLEALGRHYGFKLDDRWRDLPEKAQRRDPLRHRRGRDHASSMTTACAPTRRTKTFEGVIPNLERRWKETDSAWMREEIERFMSPRRPARPATATA